MARVRGILATKNLTLYRVAALTRRHHPHEPRYHIPGNLYFQLRSTERRPTLHQLFALSEVSDYCLADWLAVFGFRLDDISPLQTMLRRPRTTLLDDTVYDVHAVIPSFHERLPDAPIPSVAPLSQLLEPSGVERLWSLLPANPGTYRYAKIGQQDALAFPDLLPGSIVRADSRLVARFSPKPSAGVSSQIFLVEHSRGVCCCRLHLPTRNRITLLPTQHSFSSVDLQLGSEARILGVVDLEFRTITNPAAAGARYSEPEVAADLARLWTPGRLEPNMAIERPSRLLRKARVRAGLSLRGASEMTRDVAKALHDERYLISQGSLSDYEASDTPPRQIHKLLTLCILYSIRFSELVRSFGLAWNTSSAAPIPDEWMAGPTGPVPEPRESTAERPSRGLLAAMFKRLGEPPLFLRDSLASVSGMRELSLRDVFWVGGQPKAMHPAFAGALFVVVNRRRRRPLAPRCKSLWEQPVYLLRRRDGTYLLASCRLENSTIVVYSNAAGSAARPERLRNGVDVEVVGEIVTIVRSLLAPT